MKKSFRTYLQGATAFAAVLATSGCVAFSYPTPAPTPQTPPNYQESANRSAIEAYTDGNAIVLWADRGDLARLSDLGYAEIGKCVARRPEYNLVDNNDLISWGTGVQAEYVIGLGKTYAETRKENRIINLETGGVTYHPDGNWSATQGYYQQVIQVDVKYYDITVVFWGRKTKDVNTEKMIGLRGHLLSGDKAQKYHQDTVVLISDVSPGSIGWRNGLRTGDVILTVNGQPVMRLQVNDADNLLILRGKDKLKLCYSLSPDLFARQNSGELRGNKTLGGMPELNNLDSCVKWGDEILNKEFEPNSLARRTAENRFLAIADGKESEKQKITKLRDLVLSWQLTGLKKAADAGDADKQFQVGYMYLTGCGVAADKKLGEAYLTKAIAGENWQAALFLGQAKYNGAYGLTKDLAAARAAWQLAAQTGNLDAVFNLGVTADNQPEAAYYFSRVLKEQKDDAEAQELLINCKRMGGNR